MKLGRENLGEALKWSPGTGLLGETQRPLRPFNRSELGQKAEHSRPDKTPVKARYGGIGAAVRTVPALPVFWITLLLFTQFFDYNAISFPALKVLFSITPDRLVFLIIVLIVRPLLGGQSTKPTNRTELLLMGIFAFICTTSWYLTGADFGNMKYRWLATLFNLIYFPYGLFLVLRRSSYDRSAIVRLLWAIVGMGVYLVITGLSEHFHVTALVWPRYILDPTVGIQAERVRGPFATSVAMADWSIVLLLSASLLLTLAKGRARYFLLVMMPLTAAVLYFTDQRSSWLSFGMVMMLALTFKSKLQGPAIRIALIVAITFLAGVSSKFSYGQKTLFSQRQETVDYRKANFWTAFKMGMDNPFTGVGYGNFGNNWKEYFGSDESELTRDLNDGNHNTYLGLFAETGVFGLLSYVSLLLFMLGRCLNAWRRANKDQFESAFAVAGAGLVAVTIIEGAFSDLRFGGGLNTLLCLFVGIVTSMINSAPASNAEPVSQTV